MSRNNLNKKMLPQYNQLDITKYSMKYGYYTLGIFETHRKDIDFIYLRMEANSSNFVPHNEENYDWLQSAIEISLKNKKIVCIIPWDEHIVFIKNYQLSNILNRFINEPVYWITNIEENANTYKSYHNIQIKMIELPWWLLNDCLTYYRVANTEPNEYVYSKSYLSMVGNAWYPHKFELIRQLQKNNLSQYGINTAAKLQDIPEDLSDTVITNPIPPYTQWNPQYQKMAAQKQVNGIWISSNVENYLKINEHYPSIPLVINAETVMIPLFVTEKSIWPILLGRMFILYGRPRLIEYVQRFYDIPIDKFSNIEYDSINGYLLEDQLYRLECLITKNKELIKYSNDLYVELKPELEAARWTFGKNMYRYFTEQICKIV